MKRITKLIFTLILLVGFTKMNGQISKGDFIFGISSTTNYTNLGPKVPTTSLNVSYLKMVTNKLMVGGSVGYARRYSIYWSSGVRTNFNFYSTYTFNPSFRYYFLKKKFTPFASLTSNCVIQKYADSNRNNFYGLKVIAGLGVNYFLHKNIAIESVLTSNIINTGDNFGATKQYILNTGLRFYFNEKFFNKITLLPSKILRKGNIISSANFRFLRNDDENKTGNLRLNSNIRYFITDQLNFYTSLSYNTYRFQSNGQISKSIGFGFEYYYKLNEANYLSFGLISLIRDNDITFDENQDDNWSFRSVSIPLNVTYHYFKNQKKWFVGASYQYYETKRSYSIHTFSTQKRINFFGGLEYYVYDNIYLRGTLDLIKLTTNNNRGLENKLDCRLSFGMGFLIDGRRVR